MNFLWYLLVHKFMLAIIIRTGEMGYAFVRVSNPESDAIRRLQLKYGNIFFCHGLSHVNLGHSIAWLGHGSTLQLSDLLKVDCTSAHNVADLTAIS